MSKLVECEGAGKKGAKVPGRAKLWVLAAMIPFIAFGIYENAFGNRLNRVKYNFQMLSSGEKPSASSSDDN